MKAIIFDLDGVLCHTDRFHFLAWKALADRLGLLFHEEMNDKLRGVSRMESLQIILGENQAQTNYSESEKEAMACEKNQVYKKLLSDLTPADISKEVTATLEELRKRGFFLAVGSSSSNAGFILEQTGLTEYFDAVVDGNHISRSKPDPEVFRKAAEKLGVQPRECYVIEDAATGILAAKAGGFSSVAFGSAVKNQGADFEIDRLSDLVGFV